MPGLTNKKVNIFFVLVLLSFMGMTQERERLLYVDNLYKEGLAEKDVRKIAEAYFIYGKMENEKANLTKANEWFLKALQIYEKLSDSFEKGRIYYHLSLIELNLGHRQEELRLLNTAHEIFRKVNSFRGLMLINAAFGNVYGRSLKTEGVDKSDSALLYMKRSEYYAVLLKDSLATAGTRHTIGNILKDMRKPEALDYLYSSLRAYEKLRRKGPALHIKLNISEANTGLRRFTEAKSILDEVKLELDSGIDIESGGVYQHFEEASYMYYSLIGDWQNAFKHFAKLKEFEEKKMQADREGAISRLNIEYETQKKEAELAQKNFEIRLKDENIKNQEISLDKQLLEIRLKNENLKNNEISIENQKSEIRLKDDNLATQRRFLIIILSFLFFTIILSFVLYRLYRKNQVISKRNAILIQEQNHRVKNNLQVVSSLLRLQARQIDDKIARQAVDESQLRIESMAILHRQLYENDQPDAIDMEFFVRQLSSVIFHSYGMTDIETEFDIDAHDLQVDKAIYIGLMLNELISNACKYAFVNHPEPRLELSLAVNTKELILRVKDNGLAEFVPKSNTSSFGLRLIDMMVTQLDGSAETSFTDGFEFVMKCKI